MKILNRSQLQKVDAYTIENEPIASIDLMERAAKACYDWLIRHYDKTARIAVVCGTGNNGGDGLVIARLLRENKFYVDILVVQNGNQGSADFNTNLQRINNVKSIRDSADAVDFNVYTLLIDCLFGVGLNRPVEGISAEVIQKMNASNASIVSIDIPSGLYTEENNHNTGTIVKSNICLTLELPKLSLLLPENKDYVNDFEIIPIGLDQASITEQPTDNLYIDLRYAKSLYLQRSKFSHKGSFGHALICAGSYGKIGAAVLATKACARAGAGLVTAYVPKCGIQVMQTSIPEAMMLTCADEQILVGDIESDNHTVAVGPGIGQHPDTARFLQHLLKDTSNPMVIDADAINILAENKVWIRYIPDGSILTPHPKELERLIGEWKSDHDKLARVKLFCKNNDVIMVIKGAHTAVVDATHSVYFNSTGNPGMATGGSGDVLTGVVTGLLSQGYETTNAAILGVYLHGLAGDLAARELGQDAMLASDIIEHLGAAFKAITDNE